MSAEGLRVALAIAGAGAALLAAALFVASGLCGDDPRRWSLRLGLHEAGAVLLVVAVLLFLAFLAAQLAAAL